LHDRGDEPGKVCCFCISRCIHSRGLLIQGPQELIGPEGAKQVMMGWTKKFI
jgi:hypothetical protein